MNRIIVYISFVFLSIAVPNAAEAQHVSSDNLLRQALRETNVRKNYPKAIALAQRGLRISPDYTDIRLLLGRLYFMTGRYEQGVVEINRVLARQPKNRDALNYVINAAFAAGRHRDALNYSAKYLSYYPGDREMMIKRVAAYKETRSTAAAVDELESLRRRYPEDQDIKQAFREILFEYAGELRAAGNAAEAFDQYEKIYYNYPDNADALQALFNLSVQLGRNEKALTYADMVAEKTRDNGILVRKADLLKTMGRYDQAIDLATRLRAQNPADTSLAYLYKDIRYTRGKYFMETRDTSKALSDYQAILALDPSDTTARNLLINIHSERKNYPAAIAYIDSGLVYYPSKAELLTKKLYLLGDTRDLQGAYALSDSLVANNIANDNIRLMNRELFVATRKNRIGFSTSLTAFDQQNQDPWQLYSLFYMRSLKNGSVAGRVNYADRVNRTGYQFEVDAYPRHGRTYSYINFAYSESVVFPRFKFSYSYFLPLSSSWDTELGLRYLNTYFNYVGGTLAVGKYVNKFWVNAKTFQTLNEGRVVGSYILTGRYYMKSNTDDYLTAIAGYGFSPEDLVRNFNVRERIDLESLRFTIGYQRTILRRGILGIFGTWNKQEYIPGRKRNEYDISVSFQHRF